MISRIKSQRTLNKKHSKPLRPKLITRGTKSDTQSSDLSYEEDTKEDSCDN